MSSNDATRGTTMQIMSVNDLMVRWSCSRRIVLEAIKSGRLAAFRVGTRVFRVRFDEVERYERARAA